MTTYPGYKIDGKKYKIDGKKIKCPLHVKEKTLNQAYPMFKSEFCNLMIGKTLFQML